ncbi:MAG: PIG-L deacetylase family protein [bacterium]
MTKTLLVCFAHPDDEIGTAGTMAAHAARGDRVVLTFLTRGEMTTAFPKLTQEQIKKERTKDGEDVAKMLGADIHFFDFPDSGVEGTRASAVEVAKFVAEIKPDAVVTWGEAWTGGARHPDHQATGKIVRDALSYARFGSVIAPFEPHRVRAPVFTYRDRHSQIPPVYVDVAKHLDKILAVAKYYSERMGWPTHDWVLARLNAKGKPANLPYAEVFEAWETDPGVVTHLI